MILILLFHYDMPSVIKNYYSFVFILNGFECKMYNVPINVYKTYYLLPY